MPSSAKKPFKSGKISSIFYDYYDLDIDIPPFATLSIKNSGVIYGVIDINIDYDEIGHTYQKLLDGTNGIEMIIEGFGKEGTSIYCDSMDFKIEKGCDSVQWWFNTELLKEGNYKIYFDFLNRKSFKYSPVVDAMTVSYKLYNYSGFNNKVNLPKNATLKVDQTKKISFANSTGTIVGANWKSSNRKIARVTATSPNSVCIKGYTKGSCYLIATLPSGKSFKCKVKVNSSLPKLNKTKLEVPFNSSAKLCMKYTKAKVKWSSSNKKIATVNSAGKVVGKSCGKCVITAKCGGKTYKCNVSVVKMWADFTACLTDYYTRDNYFTVRFKNYGTKSIKIYSNGAYCMNVDYKSFDRKLRLAHNKDIIIKPGQAKAVNFIVKGSNTWPDYQDFTIRYYFLYNGGKYLGSVWDEDSVFKRGKKWYHTYWYTVDENHFINLF